MGYTLDIIRLYLRLTSVVPRVQNCTQGLIIWYLHFTYNKNNEVLFVTPKIRGSVNQPSTHGMSRPESRPDPIGGSEPVSGTRDSGLGLFT